MRKIFLIAGIILFVSLRSYSQADITVECENEWGPGRYNRVSVRIVFNSMEGFARFTQDFPEGFGIIKEKTDGGDFSVIGTRLNMVFMRIPDGNVADFSYFVIPDKSLSGSFNLESRLNIISKGKDKQTILTGGKPISIGGLNGIPGDEMNKQSENIIITGNKTEQAVKTSGDIVFRVQVSASSVQVTEEDIRRDIGLGSNVRITTVRAGSVFKYQAGDYPDYDSAYSLMKKLKEKGLSDSFIVAYRGNVQIPVDKALEARQ